MKFEQPEPIPPAAEEAERREEWNAQIEKSIQVLEDERLKAAFKLISKHDLREMDRVLSERNCTINIMNRIPAEDKKKIEQQLNHLMSTGSREGKETIYMAIRDIVEQYIV